MGRILKCCVACTLLLFALNPCFAGGGEDKEGEKSRLSDEKGPLKLELVPKRPKPILELGEPFLGTGTLSQGFTLPTGAVWQPQLLLFGSMRTAVQSSNLSSDDTHVAEWANRLNLFGNLQLSGSERLVFGFRNLDESGRFSGYVFDSENSAIEKGSVDEFNTELTSLYFEGDIGEIFPGLSPKDFRGTDIGFAVGRQPLFFQEGMLINDIVDGIGFTLNSLQPSGTSNFRTTFFWGWDNLNLNNSTLDNGHLYAVFTAMDLPVSTVEIDAAWVHPGFGSEEFGVVGISAVQRIGLTATSFRVLGSFSSDDALEGQVFLAEISRTPHHTINHLYLNAFYANGNFTSASRGPGNGGPLARAGVNFAGVGLGNYSAPLSGVAGDVAGGALGYQIFFNLRRQILLELGTRFGLEDTVDDQLGFTARYQVAMGRHCVGIVDAYFVDREDLDEASPGGRLELLVKF